MIGLFFGVCLAVLVVFVGYDALSALIERFSHFHIGRWKSQSQWETAVEAVCRKWAVKTPVLRLRSDCRYLLLDRLRGKNGKAAVQSWQKAGCLLGLEADAEKNAETLNAAEARLLNPDGAWSKPLLEKVDVGMLAYALLKHTDHPEKIRTAMDQVAEVMEKNLCKDGMISYSMGQKSDRRFVDTLGFVCPFLAAYGKIYGRPEYAAMAVDQLKLFHDEGIAYGLPVHCYKKDGCIPLGVYGWGRGAGWYALGLIDTYPELENIGDKAWLRACIEETAESLKVYERQEGGFSSILQDFGNYDSSATAMLGYFYARCAELFQREEYLDIARRCCGRLQHVTKISGVIDECQGDTLGVGVFSTRYGSMPFAQGMTLRLLTILKSEA